MDQQRITALDTVSVAIRGWVVTLDSALVSFAFTKADPSIIAVAIAATLLFLPLDMRYRRTQLLHAERSDRIEQEAAPDYRFRSLYPPRSRRLAGSLSRNITLTMFYTALLALLMIAFLVI